MLLIDRLAEEQIGAAIRRGEFDRLEGQGKPLDLGDESLIAGELRVAYRMLSNAGCLPPEITLRREISELEGLMHQVENTGEQKSIQRKLDLLRARLGGRSGETNLLIQDGVYRDKLLRRLTGCT